ncbi:MAG: ABC transporter permease [Verrucomicrobiae bacterium]|nr:ABC transporter permease [Verrucomicrobiae bacterium]
MLRFLARRLLQGLIVLFSLFTITFFLAKAMPGEPFTSEKNVSEAIKENMRKKFGLDRPLLTQYVTRIANYATGDFGISPRKNRPVLEIISQSFPASLVLGFAALAVAIGIGIPAGIFSAIRKNGWIDYGSMAFAMIGICVPTFVIGPILQIEVAMRVGFLKIAGWDQAVDAILPAITLGLGTAAYLARLTRSGMLEILSQDFIRTARAKGVPTGRMILAHALRGGLLPSVAFLGPAFAGLISGSFVVETIFQIPGMGQHFVNAAIDRDEFLLLGVVMFYGFFIVVMNLAADIVQALLNPRIRLSETSPEAA